MDFSSDIVEILEILLIYIVIQYLMVISYEIMKWLYFDSSFLGTGLKDV